MFERRKINFAYMQKHHSQWSISFQKDLLSVRIMRIWQAVNSDASGSSALSMTALLAMSKAMQG
jgi:hypothetical protein